MPTRVNADTFIDLLNEEEILVVKPTHSEVGIGVKIVEKKGNSYTINKIECSITELKERISKAYNNIVTEYVIQHEYARKICPTSLNTIRMLGVWNSKTKLFDIIRSFHRFGCNGNVVDNVESGNGVLVWINMENGILEKDGLINSKKEGGKRVDVVVHPDNNVELAGLKIPGYLEMKKKVLKIMNDNSYLRYIGFDVAITDDGFRIIEANGSSTPSAAQIKGGFLLDWRMRELFNL